MVVIGKLILFELVIWISGLSSDKFLFLLILLVNIKLFCNVEKFVCCELLKLVFKFFDIVFKLFLMSFFVLWIIFVILVFFIVLFVNLKVNLLFKVLMKFFWFWFVVVRF